ncbi:MAG TPA: NUDIX hydrolase [Sphingomonas sp.]|jgi:8-oxo-dGTP pyrophosphatase MutT (NUDIX family)
MHPNDTGQCAALPFRFAPTGGCEILLVTSCRRRRWIIPKGNVEPPLSPALSAAKEAYEEAGVSGMITSADIGSYRYEKRRDDGSSASMSVTVFPLAVGTVLDHWPEMSKRQRQWFDIEVAVRMVDDPELRTLLVAFARDQHARPHVIAQDLEPSA